MTNEQEQKFRVSGSDIKALHKCEFRWYYERYQNLMPINGYPSVMEVGTFGHKLMESAFEVLMNGGTRDDAIAATGATLLTKITDPDFMKVYKNVTAFVDYFVSQPWRVVAIESTDFYEINDVNEFAFTPDIIFEFLKGPYKGQYVIGDFKFTGQYWTDRQVRMHTQTTRYMLYKNRMVEEWDIKHAVVIMLNTRAPVAETNPDKLYLLKWIEPTQARLDNIERETNVMVDRIQFLTNFGKTVGDAELRQILTHTSDEFTCKMCYFADDLCPMDFDGRDTTKTLKYNYKQNRDYGYNGEKDA